MSSKYQLKYRHSKRIQKWVSPRHGERLLKNENVEEFNIEDNAFDTLSEIRDEMLKTVNFESKNDIEVCTIPNFIQKLLTTLLLQGSVEHTSSRSFVLPRRKRILYGLVRKLFQQLDLVDFDR